MNVNPWTQPRADTNVELTSDAQENCFKKNIKICIKTAQCFGLITIIRERIIRAC